MGRAAGRRKEALARRSRMQFTRRAAHSARMLAVCTVEHCQQCDTAVGSCDFCKDGYRVTDAGDACEACTSANCLQCMDSAATCDFCQDGYAVDAAGACQPEAA